MTNNNRGGVRTPAVSPETLPALAHKGANVITTELLAELYGSDEKLVRQNFERNIERFEEGKHYFKLVGGELRQFKQSIHYTSLRGVVDGRAKHLILWTERGAARHAKLLETNQAWDVFERLEDAYFRPRRPVSPAPASPPPPPTFPGKRPLSSELRTAINRKAHALALTQYDAIRDRLYALAEGLAHDQGEAAARDAIEAFAEHRLVLVEQRTLRRIAAGALTQHLMQQIAMDIVGELERDAGRELYDRGSPASDEAKT